MEYVGLSHLHFYAFWMINWWLNIFTYYWSGWLTHSSCGFNTYPASSKIIRSWAEWPLLHNELSLLTGIGHYPDKTLVLG